MAVPGASSIRNSILKFTGLEMHSSPKREDHMLDLIIVYEFVVNTIEVYLKKLDSVEPR